MQNAATGTIELLGSGLGKLTSGMPLFGAAIAGVTSVLTSLVAQVFASRDTFTTMIQSGILFNGSLSEFNTLTAQAGLSIEQFGTIAQQSSGAIKAMGEQRFLAATTQLRKTFVDFNLSVQQGTEYFGEYLETQRLSGLYFESVRGREMEAFQANIKQQQELALLTGAQVSEQRRAARARADSARYRAQLASMSPAERARIEKVSQGLAATGMNQQMIEAAIDTVIFGRTRPEFARLGAVMPQFVDQLGNFVRSGTGTPEEMQALARSYQTSLDRPGARDIIRQLFDIPNMAPVAEAIMGMQRAFDQIRNMDPAQIEQFSRTGQILDKGTQDLNEAMNRINLGVAGLRAMLVQFVSENIQWIGTQVNTLIEMFDAFRGRRQGQTSSGLQGIADYLGAGDAGRNVLQAFDQGWWTGIGAIFRQVLINPLVAWGEKLVQDFYNILPSWGRGKNPAEAEQQRIEAIATGMRASNPMAQYMQSEWDWRPGSAAPATPVPLGPDNLPNVSRITSQQQNLSTQMQIEQLIDSLNRMTSGYNDPNSPYMQTLKRIEELQAEQNRYLNDSSRHLRDVSRSVQ